MSNAAPILDAQEQSSPKKKTPRTAKEQSKDRSLSIIQTVSSLKENGSSVEDIAVSLGIAPEHITGLIGEKVEVGTPESVLQNNLETVISLIPLAKQSYREFPSQKNAQALTDFVRCSKELIEQLQMIADKDALYMTLIQKIVQPLLRSLIKEMMSEVQSLNNDETLIDKDSLKKELSSFSRNIGIKSKDYYRKYVEDLGEVLGVSIDSKIRILSTLFQDDKE
jgi:hypothetical protein